MLRRGGECRRTLYGPRRTGRQAPYWSLAGLSSPTWFLTDQSQDMLCRLPWKHRQSLAGPLGFMLRPASVVRPAVPVSSPPRSMVSVSVAKCTVTTCLVDATEGDLCPATMITRRCCWLAGPASSRPGRRDPGRGQDRRQPLLLLSGGLEMAGRGGNCSKSARGSLAGGRGDVAGAECRAEC